MQGASLSRWTMSYFAAACLFLIAGEAMMATGYGYPAVSASAPETLALVHVVAVGWLGLLMAGALLQFVPVLIARPLVGGRFAPAALLLLAGGLLALVTGFVALSGALDLPLILLPAGGFLLAAGFALLAAILAATLLTARPLPLPARFVALGLAALAATVTLGLAFALTLSGTVESPLLIELVSHGVGFHAAFGLLGWLSLTAIGVSYRLLPMFLLAPEKERATSHAVWWTGAAALCAVAAGVPVMLAAADSRWLLLAGGLLALVCIAVYGADVAAIYRDRKRRQAELNIRASFVALAALGLCALLFALPPAREAASEGAAALVYLFVFGWLSGLGLAQLYKIVPFMTWLESYGPVLGRAPVPRVQDLVDERRAFRWFCLYYGAVGAAALSIYAQGPALFRVCAAIQLVATLALVREFVRSRRLACVPETLRAPAGATRPRLFLPTFAARN